LPAHIPLAPPLWAFMVSRRFNLVERPQFRAFPGFGVAYLDTQPCGSPADANDRTPHLDYYEPMYHGFDKLNGSGLNYTLQLDVRLYNGSHSDGVAVAYRHISNAGLTNGNRGEGLRNALLVI
jgi:hypothetical protein